MVWDGMVDAPASLDGDGHSVIDSSLQEEQQTDGQSQLLP